MAEAITKPRTALLPIAFFAGAWRNAVILVELIHIWRNVPNMVRAVGHRVRRNTAAPGPVVDFCFSSNP
jgi:hypothetical protein